VGVKKTHRLEVRSGVTGDLLGEAVFDATFEEVMKLADCMNLAMWPSKLFANIIDVDDAPAPPPPADDDPQPFVVGER
jgi:hypothetical protein